LSNITYDFGGHVALVTGAARGMGAAVAKMLAEAGACVFVSDIHGEGVRRVVEEIGVRGGRAVAVELDVREYAAVANVVARILRDEGQLDILVNNAGILRRRASVAEISDEEWDLVMAVNAKGVFNCSKAVLPSMKTRRRGKIVNISSTAGRSTSELGGAHYTASKAAVLGLTRHFAREAAPYNMNAVCPALIDTPMIRETTTPPELARFIEAIPMGRLGQPEEEARLVLFLASSAASYINGATIDLTGASLLI